MKINQLLNLALIALITLSFACGGGGSSSSESTASSTPAAPPASVSIEDKYKDDPVFIAGVAKTKEAGCTACHMIQRKIVGPSYAEVAAKYENNEENIAMLTANVINGHVGTWGEVPMPAHPQLKQEDVEDMIKYVLLLK